MSFKITMDSIRTAYFLNKDKFVHIEPSLINFERFKDKNSGILPSGFYEVQWLRKFSWLAFLLPFSYPREMFLHNNNVISIPMLAFH